MDLARLAKATITNTSTTERFQVMYNPDELRLEQGNNFAEVGIPGLDAPPVQYVRGKARTLSMDLFFDSYEADQDVRSHTGPLVKLLDKEPLTKAPPVLLFSMVRSWHACSCSGWQQQAHPGCCTHAASRRRLTASTVS